MNAAPGPFHFQLRGLERTVSPSFALRVAELAIPRSEVFALLGPTGSGKSTLLSLLAGLQPPTAGQLLFDERPLYAAEALSAARRAVTLVFQRPLPIRGSVRTNVEYGLRVRGDRRATEQAAAMLRRLNLERLAGQSAATLSGGQLQLVALARALVLRPQVLLLDEPTSNLDPAHVALVERIVADEQKQHGTTVVWATHNLFQARRVAQQVALFLDGQLVENQRSETFFGAPRDPRARDFVAGKMVC